MTTESCWEVERAVSKCPLRVRVHLSQRYALFERRKRNLCRSGRSGVLSRSGGDIVRERISAASRENGCRG
jgi:hypothetical protein